MLSAEPYHPPLLVELVAGSTLRSLCSALLLGPYPPARGIGACVTRIRIDCGHLVTIRRDEYIEGRISLVHRQYFVVPRTIRVDMIRQSNGGSYGHDNPIESQCHVVVAGTVSIEYMITGGVAYRDFGYCQILGETEPRTQKINTFP